MLDTLFVQILNMSFTASFVILAVIAVRLLLKKTPRVISYVLWAVVLFRLVCPFSFESAVSLLPVNANPIPQEIVYQQTPQINTGIQILNDSVNAVLPAATPENSMNPMQGIVAIAAFLWICGISALVVYGVISLFILKRKLRGAVCEGGNIYLADGLASPFVMGLFCPKIYLPAHLSQQEKRYILLHEQTHIKRLDHVVKIVSFAVLCLHWFNPLAWVAFFLCGKDMEMSCDEAVIKLLGADVKKDYSSSLLTLATGRRIVGGSPLAFGEGDTKSRIKNVLSYKKPAFWVLVVSIVAVVAVVIGLAANPKEKPIGRPSGFAGVNAIILKIDTEGQTMIVEGVDQNSAIGDQCILDWSNANLQEIEADGNLKMLSIDAFSAGDYVALFVDEIQETYPTRAKATAIQRQDEALLSGAYSAEDLCNATTPYIGNNVAVGKLIGLLPIPMSLQYDHFALQTSSQPYRIEIVYSVSTKMLAKHDTSDSTLVEPFRKNALLLLALVDNADEVRAVLTDGNREVGFLNSREWAENTVGGDVRDFAKSPEKLQELIDFTVTSAREEAVDAKYTMMKLGKNGEVLSSYSLKGKELADAILLNALSKSAAWEGVDVSTLEECYLIRQSFAQAGEIHDYYAYRLADGTSVLQGGTNGRYSVLSSDLYLQLVDSFKSNDYLFFWLKPDEPPQYIGDTAADVWLKSFMNEQTPAESRISDYEITDVTVISGEPKKGTKWEDMAYQYVVQVTYNITTATEQYLAAADGISGKGSFQGLFRELCVKVKVGDGGGFQIVAVGTGGGEHEFLRE